LATPTIIATALRAAGALVFPAALERRLRRQRPRRARSLSRGGGELTESAVRNPDGLCGQLPKSQPSPVW